MTTEQPSEESLRRCLELEWQDHVQTRGQSWKALYVQLGLVAIVMLVDRRSASLVATTLVGFVVVCAGQFGVTLTLHHRNVQVRKFRHILNLERALGLHEPHLLGDVSLPEPIRRTDALRLGKSNSSIFILRIHLVLQFAVVVYVAAGWVDRFGLLPW